MKNTNEQWSEYLTNTNIRPKTFNVTFERDRDGTFRIAGNQAIMLDEVNQHEARWVNVDARDLASTLRNSPIVAK